MSHADRIISKHLNETDLVYVDDTVKGIKRHKCGKGFRYCLPSGQTLKDTRIKTRLAKIAVPPSYTDVWYCRDANGHIQATGYDSTGKKQYFYHESWNELRDTVKFDMMQIFGERLPPFRRKIDYILKNTDDNHDYVLAGMARILDRTGMRIGSASAVDKNKTYGLTTLCKKHVDIDDKTIELDYSGKGNVDIHTELKDRKIADVIDQCAAIPGQRLFKYKDDKGKVHKIGSTEFNRFLKDKIGDDFSAKDFRTWRFSVYFLEELLKAKRHDDESVTLKNILESVAVKSGNTPAVLQSSYVHPALIECVKGKDITDIQKDVADITGLLKNECLFLSCLKSCRA